MRKKATPVLLMVLVLQLNVVYADPGYQHVLTLESLRPENHAKYGSQIQICEDKIVLSTPYGDADNLSAAGRVYIYNIEGTLISTIHSPTPVSYGFFGWRLDMNEDIIIVSELNTENLHNAGKVHVFTSNGEHLFSIQSEEPRKGGYFGMQSIAFDDNVIAVYENAATSPGGAGVVHLYDLKGTYLKSIFSPSPKASAHFGSTIEVGGGFILIGEYGVGKGFAVGPGDVYVYDYNGTFLMTLQPPEPENQALFGRSISFSNGMIAVGEPGATVDGVFWAGKVHMFYADGKYLKTLYSPILRMGARFGDSVSISGDRLVVGEWNADVNTYLSEGRAYVFDIDGNLLQNLTAPDPCLGGAFGFDVDMDGDAIVVSEVWADVAGFGQAGRAHVFRLGQPLEAVFEVGNFVIQPSSVKVDESVTISVDVSNTGTKSGAHSVKLIIDGDIVEEKTVTVDVGVSETVVFTCKMNAVGTHLVEIENLEGSFKVDPIISGYPLNIIILGLFVMILFWLMNKKR